MMLLTILVWLLGVFCGVQLLAAFYSIVDFGYNLQRYRWQVVVRVSGWSLVCWICYISLPTLLASSFAYGIGFIGLMHLLGLGLSAAVMREIRAAPEKKYRAYVKSL